MDREPPMEAHAVVCRCCHRQERWRGQGDSLQRQVVVAGGARQLPDPGRAALEILLASARGEIGPVVALCPGCHQPMTALAPQAALPSVRFSIPTPQGALVYDEAGHFLGPEGPLSEEEARQWLERALPPPPPPDDRRITWFEGSLLLMMAAPFLVWVGTAFFVIVFLSRFELPVVQP